MLFPSTSGFIEADFLAYIAERVPPDIRDQLSRDASGELQLKELIGRPVRVDDFVLALSLRRFPTRDTCVSPIDLTSMLDWILLGYNMDLTEDRFRHDPYKLIYVATLYLHCYLHLSSSGGFLYPLKVLVIACARLDMEGRLQVSRFLGSLIPILNQRYVCEAAPSSAVVIAMSIILADVVSDLGRLAQHCARTEGTNILWKREEFEDEDPNWEAIQFLSHSAIDMFGSDGAVYKSCARIAEIVEAIEGRKGG